jgi:hypothetical protein
MKTTRIARRNFKSLPQIETTMLIEGIAKPVIACTANKDFTIGNAQINKGEKFYLVRSNRRENRYYAVHYNTIRNAFQCSCGCNMLEHDHVAAVRQYIMNNIVSSKETKTTKSPVVVESTIVESAITTPLTREQWKDIAKRDKERQRAWQQEYRDAAKALQETSVA